MTLTRKIRSLFTPRRDFVPLMLQQAGFLCQAASLLTEMLDNTSKDGWKRFEREIKTCEQQGDAILTEFQEQMSGRVIGTVSTLDLQTVAMSIDDCLDVIKDTAKAVIIYNPRSIDVQLKDLAGIVKAEAGAIRDLLPMLVDIKHRLKAISLQCDRITELEHAADEAYEEYVGYIFANEEDLREMTKYKNLAELLETATDCGKRVSDNVRKLLMKYTIR